MTRASIALLAASFAAALSASAARNDYFQIQVVDELTGRGVPLVQLRAVNHDAWWTDSNGIVAFNEPGLMEGEVFFHVSSPGYEFPIDMFHNRGLRLRPTHGGKATIKLKRLNIAERLYRITGSGIYRDSILTGHPIPLKHPVLDGQVTGQDTVIATPYRGRIYWFWGDTDRAAYPLGNYSASGATSGLPGHGGLDPSVGVDLTYFVDKDGFSKPMCPLPDPGMQWIESLMVVRDANDDEKLVARVANHTSLDTIPSWSLMVFNDQKSIFERIRKWDIHEAHDSSHPFRARVDGVEYFYLYPDLRVKADLASLMELTNYEALTCVAGGGRIGAGRVELDRDSSGRAAYSWKAGADRLHPGRVEQLIKAGDMKPGESWIDLHDYLSGARLPGGRGSVFWNEYRQRWVMLTSARAGEIWFAEADTPSGPWCYARQVLTHGDYSFYNPTQHPFFDQEHGRLIYFEGTYTAMWSGARSETPRYEYNQLMYRLALDDARLDLPAAVYLVAAPNGGTNHLMREQIQSAQAWERIQDIGWYVLPPAARGTNLVPVFATDESAKALSLTAPRANARPLFFGLPIETQPRTNSIEGSWRFVANLPDGTDADFALEISMHDGDLSVSGFGAESTASGTFKQGALVLHVKNSDGAWVLDGKLENGRLAGKWREESGPKSGTWSAAYQEAGTPERSSPALAVLREFRRKADRSPCYTTDAQPPKDCAPDGRPLCRVWRNPGQVLVLDWRAQPVGDSRR